ncbi:NLR family CARD domain-containing protein 3-like isoform X2 [Chenopodium quinoa]|uniref:NLR family CARD domain-containing protein 3-like isoform X2 n=1 Tax=Chenopodium quinoa TaxID=63459 RepID=UPI000B76EB9C|nr:NLR family CARD domain-containing protein 3-like isoform X2 [Chenopodium quinoa]
MASTPSPSSTISLSSTQLPFQPQNHPLRRGLLFPTTIGGRRRCLKLKFSAVRAAAGSAGSSRSHRVVYRESQAQNPASIGQFKEFASAIVPPAIFIAVSFVLWKVVGKILLPKPHKASTTENKPASSDMKWSFAAGTNLLKNVSQKIERDSKLKLDDFAKELRSFNVVDMSGRNFGDEGLFFLAESLAYNQVAEEVDFSANGITSAGVKAFDGILQSNIFLKTLNLSGNTIGDEGAKCLCEVLANNSGIEKLQLNSTGLEDEGAKAVAEMLKKNTTLRIIELNNNMIDYSGFASIAGALLENNTIQSLHLTGNYGGALGVAALAKGIEANKSLRDLHLHGNSMGNEGVRALMSGLSTRKGKLIQLDISNNDIGSRGAFHIAEYVKISKSLLWLNVYMNDIGDEGAEKIADALKQNRSITTIDLGGNNIHAKGISCIAEVLKDNDVITTGVVCLAQSLKVVNEALTSLDLGFNEIRDSGAYAIAQALKANEDVALTSINLTSNFITKLGQSALTDASDHVLEMNGQEVAIFF